MAKLKVGIVSAAWGAFAHLPAWRTLEAVEVVAICTSRRETAEAAQREHGLPQAFWSVADMAASGLDIIDVGTRPVLRQDMVLTALAGGKHVYAGIPFAADAAHAQAMYEAQSARGLVGVVDAYIQAIPAFRLMKEELAAGSIGEIHSVRCRFDLPLFSPLAIGVPTYAWFSDAVNGASSLRNLGSHALHALVDAFGPVAATTGMADIRLREWPTAEGGVIRPETDDTALALLRFASGVMGELYVSWSAAAGEGFRIEVQGALGRLALFAPLSFPEAFSTRLARAVPSGPMQPADWETLAVPERLMRTPGSSARAEEPRNAVFPMAGLFSGMVAAIRNGGEAAPSFRQALHVQRVVEAVLASGPERAWKALPPF